MKNICIIQKKMGCTDAGSIHPISILFRAIQSCLSQKHKHLPTRKKKINIYVFQNYQISTISKQKHQKIMCKSQFKIFSYLT